MQNPVKTAKDLWNNGFSALKSNKNTNETIELVNQKKNEILDNLEQATIFLEISTNRDCLIEQISTLKHKIGLENSDSLSDQNLN